MYFKIVKYFRKWLFKLPNCVVNYYIVVSWCNCNIRVTVTYNCKWPQLLLLYYNEEPVKITKTQNLGIIFTTMADWILSFMITISYGKTHCHLSAFAETH